MTENQRFRNIIKKYRESFNLSQNDISMLIGITQSVYKAVENGRGTIDLDKADMIAKVYGLRYWELVHPSRKSIEVEKLPVKTKKLVLARKHVKRTPKNRELQLPEKINAIFSSGKLPREFTSSDIWSLLPTSVRDQVKTIRITDTLKKGSLRNLVEETGEKRSHEKLYRLK
ncbi:helix-turn-helix domain-containing protein [Chryseobacterium gallinarum]|uniref:helix-turn-helix transcriptional regulator n=1 Tax=Chryseobacterium gallinarum TaxID=1324352 RepID=UPI0020241B7B|nr:helix-turn-helix transcriptional regulator [Chryseobacterium gallinarum]MCL8537666.1 helix-turn-helix domain-containing protein [Chryseobacterium gallinarum]